MAIIKNIDNLIDTLFCGEFSPFRIFFKKLIEKEYSVANSPFFEKEKFTKEWFFIFFSKLEKSPELCTIWKGCYFHILNTAKFGLNILMDDPPLQATTCQIWRKKLTRVGGSCKVQS